MKVIFVFALFVVGINAFPKINFGTKIDLKNERLVTDAIASAIQDLSQSIKDAGLDPLHIESESGAVALPVPVLFSAKGIIEELLFTGISEIVINNLSFSILTYRVTFDISLPLIEASLNKAEIDVIFFGKQYTASAAGRLAISTIRVDGNVRVSVGIISGISVRSLDINFSLGGIESSLNVGVQNWDLSNSLNTFLGTTIPTTLNDFSAEINELLEIIVEEVLNEVL